MFINKDTAFIKIINAGFYTYFYGQISILNFSNF